MSAQEYLIKNDITYNYDGLIHYPFYTNA